MSGNPLTMAAGHAVLAALRETGCWEGIADATATLAHGLRASARRAGIAVQVPHVGTMLSVFFSEAPVVDLVSATNSATASYTRFFHAMLRDGIYLPPSPFESWFVSAAHDADVIERTLRAADRAFVAAREQSTAIA
jgi:glutamate-1-semialdehyde 2,1-aminomutase